MDQRRLRSLVRMRVLENEALEPLRMERLDALTTFGAEGAETPRVDTSGVEGAGMSCASLSVSEAVSDSGSLSSVTSKTPSLQCTRRVFFLGEVVESEGCEVKLGSSTDTATDDTFEDILEV